MRGISPECGDKHRSRRTILAYCSFLETGDLRARVCDARGLARTAWRRRLDPRLCVHRLRAGRRTLLPDRPPGRQCTGAADERRPRQGRWLAAAERRGYASSMQSVQGAHRNASNFSGAVANRKTGSGRSQTTGIGSPSKARTRYPGPWRAGSAADRVQPCSAQSLLRATALCQPASSCPARSRLICGSNTRSTCHCASSCAVFCQ